MLKITAYFTNEDSRQQELMRAIRYAREHHMFVHSVFFDSDAQYWVGGAAQNYSITTILMDEQELTEALERERKLDDIPF